MIIRGESAQPVRYFASTQVLTDRRGQQGGSGKDGIRVFIQQNNEIGKFAKKGDWDGLLNFAVLKHGGFNEVNWATTFSKLGRLNRETHRIKFDPRFSTLLGGLEERFSQDRLGVREVRMCKS